MNLYNHPYRGLKGEGAKGGMCFSQIFGIFQKIKKEEREKMVRDEKKLEEKKRGQKIFSAYC